MATEEILGFFLLISFFSILFNKLLFSVDFKESVK
jgi:hypothetical protein